MYLIDTDILIYNLKNHEQVRENFRQNASFPKAISVISYGELYFGAIKSKYSAKNLANVKRIGELFKLIDIHKEIIEVYGELKSQQQLSGLSIADFDLLIAATALFKNYILVTNNERHFQRVPGLKIDNWTK
jgi:tRNA(fMet)-specific endonuclease VapC